MSEKLTKAQLDALAHLSKWGTSLSLNFKVGEALRRRGLVERYTTYIIRAVYANADGEHEQYDRPADNPVVWHEWDLTKAGRSALKEASDND